MTSEQQRAVDQAIIEGRLVDAIAAYRAATGLGLAQAEDYVRQRNATLAGSPAVSRTDGSLSPSSVRTILWIVGIIVVTSIVVPLLITAGALYASYRAIAPQGLTHGIAGLMTIKNEPYYPVVVAQIRNDAKFKAALGAPIGVDDDGVTCSYIHDDPAQHKANCTIPVHGPKAAGTVHVQLVDQAGGLDLGAWLHVGDRTIPIDS